MDVWLLLAVTGPLWGFLFWLAFSTGHGFLYLESLRDKLGFFFSPWMPKWYILVKNIDGSVEQFFDARVEKGRGKYLLRLGKAGEVIAVMEKDPDEAAVPIAIWDARGPPGTPSPYGLAWRVAVGWAFAVYMAFVAWDFTFLSAAVANEPVPPEGWLSLTIFMVEFSYLWQLFAKMNVPSGKYLGLVTVGVNPPHLRVVPEISVFDPRPPAAMLEMLARKMEIIVPRELAKIVEKLKERLGTDEAVAAWIAAQAEMATIWRKNLAEVRSEMTTVRTIARRMIRVQGMRELRPSLSKLLVWGFFFLVGLVVGYVFGSSWTVSIQMPVANTSAGSAVQAPYTGTSSVTPAPAPPPPPSSSGSGSSSGASVTPAHPPPPPPG